MVWDDGNSQFYGIESARLTVISKDIVVGSDWHVAQVPSSMGTHYLMVRRTPVVDMKTGEVVAHLYIGVVLNNNYSLVNVLASGSNADELFLAVGSEIIASSTKPEDTRHIEWLEQSLKSINASRYLVSRTDLAMSNTPTFLSVYNIQSNEHIDSFVQNQYLWMVFTGVLIAFFAVYTRLWWLSAAD